MLYNSYWRIVVRHFDIRKGLVYRSIDKHQVSYFIPNWKGKPRKLSKDLVCKLQNAPFKLLLYEMNQCTHPYLIFVLLRLSEPLGYKISAWFGKSRSLLFLWLAVTPLQIIVLRSFIHRNTNTVPFRQGENLGISAWIFPLFQLVKLSRKCRVWRWQPTSYAVIVSEVLLLLWKEPHSRKTLHFHISYL